MFSFLIHNYISVKFR